jgi:hypothetical protein
LEEAVQGEVDTLRPRLPNVDDSALERLVVQLRTVQVSALNLHKSQT